jgi:pimeloyl-ACP methyl ester carboxylesterase
MAPPGTTADEAAERAVAGRRVTGSPAFPTDEDEIRQIARLAFERCSDPPGVSRQLAAIYASGDRTEDVRAIGCPTLVIHGVDDPLIRVTGGRATAAAVEGAELIEIEGMGHDLPRQLWPRLADTIAQHVERAELAAAPRA